MVYPAWLQGWGGEPLVIPSNLMHGRDLMLHGGKLIETWENLAFEKPPDDVIGQILWFFGTLGQIALSIMFFPATLSQFLMEESMQSAGMGAYILSSARQYDLLDEYLPLYLAMIESGYLAAKDLSVFSPMVGGAVIIYSEAAKMSYLAFRNVTDRQILKQAEKDETLRKKLLEDTKYGQLRLTSIPSQADIYIDDVNTELLTPETFKKMEEGIHLITLQRYDSRREVTDVYSFTIRIQEGRKIELRVRIPEDAAGEEDIDIDVDEIEGPQLPLWVTAEVMGDRAIDGDTFVTTTGERIRIPGIDAPELGRPWADMAHEYLASLVEDKKVELKIQTHLPFDTYGRTLAVCKSWKGNIGVLMLSAGLARMFIAEDAIMDPARYIAAEQTAKERRIGIWTELP